MIKGALVMEGGALRGVYTSGVLDIFIEHGIKFEYVIGVSAGAVNAQNYVSGQMGRTVKINIEHANDPEYKGFKPLITKGNIFNFDFLFGKKAEEIVPFDRQAFINSNQRCVIGATNCLTGKQIYFESNNYYDLIMPLKASCSMPIVSRLVYMNRVPYTDGGVSCSIPFQQAKAEGYGKIVIILTRPYGYVSKNNKVLNHFFKIYYWKYPQLIKKRCTMSARYNKLLSQIEELERNRKIFVIRPSSGLRIKQFERSCDKLKLFYLEGKEDAKSLLPQILEYIQQGVED